MKLIKFITCLIIVLFALVSNCFALNYGYRDQNLNPTVEVGFQNYDVDTVSKDDSAFAEASLSLSGFNGEFLRLVNDSIYDALIKINDKDEFTLQAGGNLSIAFDNITSVKVKSKAAAQTTVVEVSVWGRNDLDM